MKAVNIAELKNNLSSYLRKVRSGEEIIVRDRDIPIAKIVPLNGEYDDELLALAAQGLVRLGKGKIDDDFWQLPDPPRVSRKVLRDVMRDEREGR